MTISGFIETNSTPELCSIEELCKSKGFDIEVDESTNNNTHATIRYNQLNISLFVTNNGINYKTKMHNLFSYAFISVIIIALLYKLLPLGVWIMLLFFVPLTLIAIKVVYDKRVYKIVDSVIPESLKFLPEKATKEQLEWLKIQTSALLAEQNAIHITTNALIVDYILVLLKNLLITNHKQGKGRLNILIKTRNEKNSRHIYLSNCLSTNKIWHHIFRRQ